MNRKLLVFISGIACMIISCSPNPQNGNPTDADSTGNSTTGTSADSTYPPVETKSANTTYKPAFAGQTRVAGIRTTTAYEGRMLTDQLNKPWGITSLPDGRFLVTEKGGTMRIVSNSGAVGQPIGGIPAVNSNGQGGLLGITLDPAFPQNRMVYWTFSENTADGNLTAVAKGKLSANEQQMENVTVIYRATPAYNGNLHYGSRIIFDKNGNLMLSTGERSDKVTRPQAQQLNSANGKILRITTDGKPAAGNPFLNNSSAKPEI